MTSSLIVASESTWGTVPASGWRELEVLSDGHSTVTQGTDYKGIRSSSGAKTAAHFRNFVDRGTGTIEVGGFSNGLGILLKPFFDTATSEVVEDGTDAYAQTFTWGPDGPPNTASITTEVRRGRYGSSTVDAFTYSGGRGVTLGVSQDVDDNLMFSLEYDYKTVLRQSSLPARTIAEVEPELIYNWRDALISIGGSDRCLESFSLDLPTGINVDDKCIKRGDTRHVPMRQGTPEPTGSARWKYADPVFYDAFISGEPMALEASWVGPTAIEDTTFPGLTITVGAIRFTGEDPQISVDDPTMQDLPFEILDNGTDPVVEMVFVTSDVAL